MAFLNKLMIHLNNATKEALKEGNNTLDKKLYAFLCKMLEADADGKMICEEIRNLNDDVVYFVLNGTDIRNNERAFVAGMNWAKLDERLLEKTFLENTALDGVTLESETGNKTLLYSSKKENLRNKKEEAQYINRCWNLVWEDYLQLTMEQQDKNNLFTFNHWLLNKTKHPLNIGVYWGEQDETKEIDGGYFHLSIEALRKLGALDVKKDDFNPLQLPRDYSNKISYDRDLNDIEKHMSEMEQDDEGLNNISNIGFAVYHIIRSYGCWGGNSFYSVPINYGSAKEKRIGVLSICTKKPLSEKMIERWSLVANKIFKDIILHEIDLFKELERKSNFIRATYSLGHNLKNRVLDGDKKIEEIRTEVEKMIDNFNTLSNQQFDKKKILEQISNSGLQVKSLSNTGNLLDLIARAMTEKFDNIFLQKEDWHSKNEKGLSEFLVSLYKDKFYVVSKLGNYGAINLEKLADSIKIKPWLENGAAEQKIRPADFIYEEIFFELFVNALGYGYSAVEDGKNLVQIDVYNEGNKIIVANTPSKPLNENTKFNSLADNTELNADAVAHGGLLYISNFLTITNTGSLNVCLDKKGNKFKIVMQFEGLTM